MLSADFKGTEIEVAVLAGTERFRKLTDAEIDDHLTAINENET